MVKILEIQIKKISNQIYIKDMKFKLEKVLIKYHTILKKIEMKKIY